MAELRKISKVCCFSQSEITQKSLLVLVVPHLKNRKSRKINDLRDFVLLVLTEWVTKL
jgi:hypothetical protein